MFYMNQLGSSLILQVLLVCFRGCNRQEFSYIIGAYLLQDDEKPPPKAQPAVNEEVQDVRSRHLRTEIPNYNNKEQQR